MESVDVLDPAPGRIRASVRSYYAGRAVQGTSCCGSGGCGVEDLERIGAAIGYSAEELGAVPEGVNLGLGCGNPTAIERLRPGSTVLDLGSGAGFDALLAARQVGPTGQVIGVDMTPEMIDRARDNAARVGLGNVAFRLGEIEYLPVETATVDAVISNCVINLSPDKDRVFAEAFRVLKPGGRLMVSDLVLTRALPPEIRESAEAYAGCIAGAEERGVYLERIRRAGFQALEVVSELGYFEVIASGDDPLEWLPETVRGQANSLVDGTAPVVSLNVRATKPL